MHTLKYFMWGYQLHFQAAARIAAENVFNKLDANLKPRVFLVGVLQENQEGSYPICVEPEDCGYDPDLFSNVKQDALHLEALDGESHMNVKVYPDQPDFREKVISSFQQKTLRDAIQNIINRLDESRGLISFCSWPILVQNYMVCVILQLDSTTFKSYYSLGNKYVDEFWVATSLLEAVIKVYLEEYAERLRIPEPGSEFGTMFRRNAEEIVRSAGNLLMLTAANAGVKGAEREGIFGFFQACNSISSLRYESKESVGKMLIAKRGHPNIKVTLSFETPVKIREYRAVRKLLELSSNEICLLADSAYIYGLGYFNGIYDQKREDLFQVNFIKHYIWNLSHADQVLMWVAYGLPSLPRMRINEEKFKQDLRRIFKGIEQKNTENLLELVLEATKQKHGTMAVISKEAEKESLRLEQQCIRIGPIQLTPDVMGTITSIDGAVLIDEKGACYAIGVILDGLASKKGTSSRGARYNSAIRYIEGKQECMAIVVSTDGSVDTIPTLKPQIKRSDIYNAVLQLKSIKDSEKINQVEFNKLMEWFNDHVFYLLPDVCDEVNKLRKEIEVKIKDSNIRIVYHDFKPNEEMDESYFLEE